MTQVLLVMAFRTLKTADVFYCHLLHTCFLVVLKEFVIVRVVVGVFHNSLAVAVDTPAHSKRRALLYDFHLCYLAVALRTL